VCSRRVRLARMNIRQLSSQHAAILSADGHRHRASVIDKKESNKENLGKETQIHTRRERERCNTSSKTEQHTLKKRKQLTKAHKETNKLTDEWSWLSG
jgi:hypothetical protein